MKSSTFTYCLIAVAMVGSHSSCLMRQTVTENGEEISSDYVVKRPIKDLIDHSEDSN